MKKVKTTGLLIVTVLLATASAMAQNAPGQAPLRCTHKQLVVIGWSRSSCIHRPPAGISSTMVTSTATRSSFP